MIKFSARSILALPRFFAYRNEFDIFTEDRVADKEFYKSIFKRLFQDKVKINDVTPLGCKANVLSAYENQPEKVRRKQFYIIDGDLDLVIGTNRKSERNLIVLDSYCIENYIINENGAVELIYLSCGNVSKEEVKNRLDYEKWLGNNAKPLVDLFLHFAILKKHGGGPRLRNANEFLKHQQKETIIDQSAVEFYTAEIKKEIIKILADKGYQDPNGEYDEEIKNYRKSWNYDTDSLLKIVSGKNYLLPILQHRVSYCIGKGKMLIRNDSLKLFLANNSDLSRLNFLTEIIK